jgi:hypothetical protein
MVPSPCPSAPLSVSGRLSPPHTSATETASELGRKYPSAVKTFTDAWERFTPFLAFPPELRRVIYTTNSIESLNYQLRKVTKSRGHFPNDAAAVKLLWLAICNIEDKRARDREKERGLPSDQRRAASAGSSRTKPPRTGNTPSNNSPWPTPTASSPTYNQPISRTAYTETLTSSRATSTAR